VQYHLRRPSLRVGSGELEGLRSLRLGRYRVIFRPDTAGAEIIAIGPRRTIYEETEHLLRRK
jgi:hypothetical protein